MEQPDTDSARRFEEVKLISEQIASMIEAIDRINTLGHRQEHRKIQAELAFLYPQLVKLHLSVRSKLYVQDFADIATQEHLDHFREQFAASAVIFSELEEIDTTGELKKWCERKTHEEQRVAIERVKVAADQHSQKKADERTRTEIESFIYSHADVLSRKRQQLVYKDDYGNEKMGKWAGEMKYFIREVLVTNFDLEPLPTDSTDGLSANYMITSGAAVLLISVRELASWIESAAMSTNRDVEMSNAAELDPIEFEMFVANILSGFGWDTNTTRASGDQGVDVLASSSGLTVAIQCKRYTGQVGNEAVQQVFAGKAHYLATHAAVVTTTNFTPAARQLAQSTGVLLLHHSDLANLRKLVGIED